jgi:hypothetical protein
VEHTRFIGLDIHKERISVAVAQSGRTGAVEYLGEIANEPGAISKLCGRLRRHGKALELALGDAKISDLRLKLSDLRLKLSDLRVDLFDCSGHDAFPFGDRATANFQSGWTEMANHGDHEMARAFS